MLCKYSGCIEPEFLEQVIWRFIVDKKVDIKYIDLSKIIKMTDSDIPVDAEFSIDDFQDNSISFSSPVKLSGKITNLSGSLTVDATLEFSVELVCDRCLAGFTKNYKLPFSDEIAPINSDKEIDEYIPYSNGRVSLSDAVYKCIFSEMDIKNICKSDCKGLCGSCGTDLNEGTCDCQDDDIDPRLLKLKALLK